jgi:hypothetical protein
MDRYSRTERLYRHLLGMGLYVAPVFADASHERIDYLYVRIDLPPQSAEDVPAAAGPRPDNSQASGSGERATCGLVASPVARTEIGQVIATAENPGDNVIYLPPVLG